MRLARFSGSSWAGESKADLSTYGVWASVLALWATLFRVSPVVVLGDPDDHLMTLRMQAANQLSSSTPAPAPWCSRGTPSTEGRYVGYRPTRWRAWSVGRHRGAESSHPCVIQERASNNTAQHLVCTGRVLEQLRLDDEDRVVVTNKFHRRRVRSFLDLMSGRDPRWAAARIVAAENSLAVSWRARDEADRFMDRVESDLDGAMRANCRARSATCAALW